MARRIEICVPTEYQDVAREILESPDKCDLGENSGKAGIIVEVEGKGTTIFTVTVPSGSVSGARCAAMLCLPSERAQAIWSTCAPTVWARRWARWRC